MIKQHCIGSGRECDSSRTIFYVADSDTWWRMEGRIYVLESDKRRAVLYNLRHPKTMIFYDTLDRQDNNKPNSFKIHILQNTFVIVG